VSDGEHHGPAAPRPCATHRFLAAPFVTQLLAARVRVGLIEDDAPLAEKTK
jgi:hypothetical protein